MAELQSYLRYLQEVCDTLDLFHVKEIQAPVDLIVLRADPGQESLVLADVVIQGHVLF